MSAGWEGTATVGSSSTGQGGRCSSQIQLRQTRGCTPPHAQHAGCARHAPAAHEPPRYVRAEYRLRCLQAVRWAQGARGSSNAGTAASKSLHHCCSHARQAHKHTPINAKACTHNPPLWCSRCGERRRHGCAATSGPAARCPRAPAPHPCPLLRCCWGTAPGPDR